VFENYGTFATSPTLSAAAFSTISAQFINNSGTTNPAILVNTGTLDFANNDSFGGTITGAGMFELSGGGFYTLVAGVTVTAGSLYVSGANGNGQLQLAVLGSLSYAGQFLQDAGTTIDLDPGTVGTKAEAPTLTLSNTSDLSGSLGGTFVGGTTARLVLDSTNAPLSDDGLVVRGSMTVDLAAGEVKQGGTVIIGLLSGDSPTLEIDKGALYDINAPSVLTGVGTITNAGTFQQDQQVTAASIVSAYFDETTTTATVLVKSGTLEFTGSDTFSGTIAGSGAVALSGAFFTLASGLLVTASTLEVSASYGAADVLVMSDLAYNGAFTQTGNTTLTLAGPPTVASATTLTLTGTDVLNGTILGSASTELQVSKTANGSDGGMELTGGVTFLDQGYVGQQGQVVVGVQPGDNPLLQVAAGAIYNLTVVSDISGDGRIVNYGTFEQAIGVTSTSVVSAEFVNSDTVTTSGTTTIAVAPTILSNGGILEFTGSDTFHGTIGGAGTIALSGASFTFEQDLTVTAAALMELQSSLPTNVQIASATLSSGALTTRTLSYAGQFTQTANTTLSLDGLTTLDLTGALDSLSGIVEGVGGVSAAEIVWSGPNGSDADLELTGNVTLIDSGKIGQAGFATIGTQPGDNASLDILAGATYDFSEQSTLFGDGSVSNFGTFEQDVSVTGRGVVAIAFTNESGATVLGTTGTLEFTGSDTFAGTITGNGEVALSGADFTLDSGVVLAVAAFSIDNSYGAADVTILGSVNSTGTVVPTTLAYAGVLTQDSDTTLSLSAGLTLNLSNARDVFNGTVEGFGTLTWAPTAQGSDAGITVTGAATLLDSGFIGQAGTVTVGLSAEDSAELIVQKNASYNFRAPSLLTGNGIVTVDTGGVFGQGNGSVSDLVNVAVFNSAGTVTVGSSGTIEFSGADSFTGAITGAGVIELSGGSFTLGSPLAVTVSTLDLASNLGAADVTIVGTISYAGTFSQASNSVISFAAGSALTLSGGADVLNGTLSGQSTLLIGKAVSSTDNGLILTGAMQLLDGGSIGQNGTVTVGLSAGDDTSQLIVATTGTYTLQNYAAINGFGSVDNRGTLLKQGTTLGGGTSTIAPSFINAVGANVTASAGMLLFNTQMQNDGTVTATTGGTVDFAAAVTAVKGDTGTLDVNSNGALIFGNAVGATETVGFSDDVGVVVLNDASLFDAAIVGFQATVSTGGKVTQSDSIDVTNANHTGLTATYAPTTTANTSGILTLTETVNGVAATVGALHFTGTYTLASFAFAADSTGSGTVITDPPATAKITAANTSTSAAEFTNVGTATETVALLPAGNGIEQVLGFKANGLDVIDLKNVLAGASGQPTLADIGNYITATDSDGSTTLYYDPTGHGHGAAFAVLEGVNSTIGGLLSHHALSLG